MEITSYLLGKKSGGGGDEPTGTINITSNGTKNVKSYATANVNVQPNLQNKSITVNTNGSTSISADSNYDGLDTVSITTSVQPDLETKSITITENKTTTVLPTSGKDGLSSVQITTNVSGGGSSRDWTQIGYTEEPETIQIAFDYAKQIYNTWDDTITNRYQAYAGNHQLKFFPDVDTSKITNAKEMFSNSSVEKLGDFDFSSITDAQSMFASCYELYEVGDVHFTSNSKIGNMFSGCTNLKKVNSIDIKNSNNSSNVFYNCRNLETIGSINTTLTSNSNNIFSNCNSLSNNTLKIILSQYCKKLTAQGSNYKKLSAIGLSQTQAELCTTFDEWTELANAGWTTGY